MPIAQATEPAAMRPLPSLRSWLLGCERGLLLGVTLLIVAIPLAQMAARTLFDYGLIGAGALSQNLALWIGWLGAIAAADIEAWRREVRKCFGPLIGSYINGRLVGEIEQTLDAYRASN